MGETRKFTAAGGRGLSGHTRQRTHRSLPRRECPAVITGQGEYEHRMSDAETWAAGIVAMWIAIALALFLAAMAAVIWVM